MPATRSSSASSALPPHVGVGACSFAVCSIAADGRRVPSDRVQLTPVGAFRGLNGLPADAPHWYIDAGIAANLIAQSQSRVGDLVIDYDHQTLFAAKTGVKAVAAAWWSGLEWEEGVGLFAVGVQWTAAAAAHIEADEFRYISPVFTYDKKTGAVLRIVNAALTNTPNIDGMADVANLVAASLATASLTANQPTEANMDELLEQLRWLLNLPVGATADDVKAQLQKLLDQLKTGEAQAAASFDLLGYLDKLKVDAEALATASAVAPDPSQFVPMATFQATQNELASLRLAVNSEKVDALVKGALADGRLLPAQETWARDLGKSNLAALSQFIGTATPNPALSGGLQSDATKPGAIPALTGDQLAVCNQMGVSPEDFAKNLAAASAAG